MLALALPTAWGGSAGRLHQQVCVVPGCGQGAQGHGRVRELSRPPSIAFY